MGLLFTGLLIFIVNLPFGYLREGQKKFSFLWFLYIHLPVPFSIAIRFLFDVQWKLHTFPVFIGSYFLGQFLGAIIRRYLNKKKNHK